MVQVIKEPVYIDTLKGIRRIRKVSLGHRQELALLLDAIFKKMVGTDGDGKEDTTFAEMYDNDLYFQQMCNDACQLGGIHPEDIDIDTLYALLLPHTGSGGAEVRESGILYLLNFPQTNNFQASETGSKSSWESIIATLWHISGTLQDALDSIYDGRIDADSLMKTIDEFSKLQNPEEYMKRKLKQKALESIHTQEKLAPVSGFQSEPVDMDSFMRTRQK